jgi:hypothetical protein
MFDVFHNLDSRRMAVPFTAIMAMAVPLIVAILAMAVLFTLAITATSIPVEAQQTGLPPTVAKEAPHVLRVDWPAIKIASATYEILEEIA